MLIWIAEWIMVTAILYGMLWWWGNKSYREGFDRAKEIALREIDKAMKERQGE
jgi:hypothetical protein